VPLRPMPSMAMLITMKAKWYHREIEKTLVSVISKDMAEIEQKNIPAKRRRRLMRKFIALGKEMTVIILMTSNAASLTPPQLQNYS